MIGGGKRDVNSHVHLARVIEEAKRLIVKIEILLMN